MVTEGEGESLSGDLPSETVAGTTALREGGLRALIILRGVALDRRARNVFHGVLARRSGLGQRAFHAVDRITRPVKSSLWTYLPAPFRRRG